MQANPQNNPRAYNGAGERLHVAEAFGNRFGKSVQYASEEGSHALLSNAQYAHKKYGSPRVTSNVLIDWIADWIARDGETLGKPTHFDVTDGRF